MHLIACGKCHRQFDVTEHRTGDLVRCLCDEVLAVEENVSHAPRAIKCSECGAPLEDGARSCGFCTSEITIEERRLAGVCPECYARMAKDAKFCMECGVKIAPQSLAALPEDADCPRCDGALRTRVLGPTSVVECAGCAGLWLTPRTFEDICDNVDQQRRVKEAMFRPRQDVSKPRVAQDFKYLRCVVCSDMMVPRNYGRRSGIVIDVCRDHGVWLDHSELECIIDFLRKGVPARDLGGEIAQGHTGLERRKLDYGRRGATNAAARDPRQSGLMIDVMGFLRDFFDIP